MTKTSSKAKGLASVAVAILFSVVIVVTHSSQGFSSALRREGSVDFGSDGGPEAEGDPEFGAFGLPEVLRDEDSPTDDSMTEDPNAILPEKYLARSVPWREPNFKGQDGAIGWQSDVFSVPASMRQRVAFWKDIYSKFTTDQGVLHDIDDLTRVYTNIDFKPLAKTAESAMTVRARERSRQVDRVRKEIIERLTRLSKMKSEKDVADAEDRRYISMFTKDSVASLFEAGKKKDLEALKTELKKAGTKKRVRFQLGQKDKFILGIYYSGRYLRSMEEVFRQEKLPIELTRLPFVESSFNILARSRVGASGVWQFMPRTAKPTMMVNRDVDERNDPQTATMSAARLMRSNFEQLRSWPLALTAYNHGAAGMLRAVKKSGSRELPTIIEKYQSRRFGFASSNFYACFLAALEVERQAKTLFGDVKWSLEYEGRELDIKHPIPWSVVVDFYDGDSQMTELQNPHFTSRVRKKGGMIPKGTFIRVPTARYEIAAAYMAGQIPDAELQKKLALIPVPNAFGKAEEGLAGKLGEMSESARTLLPFLRAGSSISEAAPSAPTPVPKSNIE